MEEEDVYGPSKMVINIISIFENNKYMFIRTSVNTYDTYFSASSFCLYAIYSV